MLTVLHTAKTQSNLQQNIHSKMLNWIPLATERQLDELVQLSFTEGVDAVAIFKHSTRCSISSMVKNRLERVWNVGTKNIPVYYLDLIAFRSLSNEIANRFGIEHESPQLLFIQKGKVVSHASHSAIEAEMIETL